MVERLGRIEEVVGSNPIASTPKQRAPRKRRPFALLWSRFTFVPAIGDPAPAFTLPNQDGEPVSLTDFEGSWLLLWWYPKASTPG